MYAYSGPESTISAIASLLPEDLLDPPGGVTVPAAPRLGRDQTTFRDMSQVGLDGLPGDLGDRDSAPIRLVAQSGIEVVRELHRRPFHGMPAYREPERSQTDSDRGARVIAIPKSRARARGFSSLSRGAPDVPRSG